MAGTRGPLIYISYGIMKSGSTLAFELTKTILEQNGFSQKRLSRRAIPTAARMNFVPTLTIEQLEAIEREAERLGYPIVLKSHQSPGPAVEEWAREGRIQGHCVYRDLREVALSMMDHGSRSRAKQRSAFSRIDSLDEAIRSIRKQVPRFREWAQLPGFLPLYYDDVAFDTQATVQRLCRQMGVDADPARVERHVKGWRRTGYNKGVPGRHREMAPEDSARILQEFRDFYGDFIESRPAPERPLQPAPLPLITRLLNRLRQIRQSVFA